jgi:cytochrome c oxidase subunit 4
MAGHIVPARTYFLVFAALVVLTAVTTAVAFVDLGPLNTVVALAIAVCKACLVVLFFMHVKYAPGLTRVVVVTGFLWLALLIGISLSDVVTRPWTPIPQGWQTSSASPSPANQP